MLSSMLKEHQVRQQKRKDSQGNMHYRCFIIIKQIGDGTCVIEYRL